MKVTDTFLQEITDFGLEGEGVTKIDDNVVFVPFAVQGDLCKIKITEVKKNLATAKLVKVIRPSENRTTPICNAFEECGGCVLQHINFKYENEMKRELLSRTLKKAGINTPINDMVYGRELSYRNKLQLPFSEVDGRVALGFFKRGTHSVIPLTKCYLNGEWAEKLISIVTFWANDMHLTAYNEKTGEGLLRHLVVRRVDNFYYVTLVINGKNVKDTDKLYFALSREFDVALYISVNEKRNNVIMGDSVKHVYGKERYVNIDGLKVKLSPMSFLQVNDEIRCRLYGAVSNEIKDADYIFDVYSGVGLLTAKLAKNNEKAKVYGLEIVEDAVKGADILMRDNGLSERVKNILGDASIELPKLTNEVLSGVNDTIKPNICTVIDPPRKGCDERVLDAIIKSNSSRVVYISCNPATLQRDLKKLIENYDVTSVTPFNMFPRTAELETLVVLNRR